MIILLCILSSQLYAQQKSYVVIDNSLKDSLMYESGRQMIKFYNKSTTGSGLILIGSVFGLIGSEGVLNSGGLQLAGVVSLVVGSIILLSAPNHIGIAGNLTQYASGVPINFRKKHKRK